MGVVVVRHKNNSLVFVAMINVCPSKKTGDCRIGNRKKEGNYDMNKKIIIKSSSKVLNFFGQIKEGIVPLEVHIEGDCRIGNRKKKEIMT